MDTFKQYLTEAKRPNINFKGQQDYKSTEWVPIARLKKYQGNTLGKTDVVELKKDIEENGLNYPLTLYVSLESSMAILGEGNHRMRALELAKFREAPVLTIVVGYKYMNPGRGVPVKIKPGIRKDWYKISNVIEGKL